jgi:hypothetical protein
MNAIPTPSDGGDDSPWLPELVHLTVDDLRAIYDQAVRAGAWLERDEARLAGCAPLVGHAVRRAPGLWLLAALFEAREAGSSVSAQIARGLTRDAAFQLYTLDLALDRHARDVGYDSAPWRQGTATMAHAINCGVHDDHDGAPLVTLVGGALDATAQLVVALAEDRMAFPELLADALSRLLLVRAATLVELEPGTGR